MKIIHSLSFPTPSDVNSPGKWLLTMLCGFHQATHVYALKMCTDGLQHIDTYASDFSLNI